MYRKIFTAILLLVSVTLCVCGCGIFDYINSESRADSDLVVRYIDVGQGDCELIMLPDGRNIIIDGGTGKTEDKLVSLLKSYGVEKLDYVIATHPHEDHIGGLDKVVENFNVGAVYMPYVSASTVAFEKFAAAVKKSGAEVLEAKAGTVVFDEDFTEASFLAPNGTYYDELNNYSAVLKFRYGTTVFLFMGDAEKDSEREILSNFTDIKCDVLKVGHHGSKTGTTAAFAKAVNPKVAVIEVGKNNSYGHPHSLTLKTLDECLLYRTDIDGTITVVCDGNGFNIYTEKQGAYR